MKRLEGEKNPQLAKGETIEVITDVIVWEELPPGLEQALRETDSQHGASVGLEQTFALLEKKRGGQTEEADVQHIA